MPYPGRRIRPLDPPDAPAPSFAIPIGTVCTVNRPLEHFIPYPDAAMGGELPAPPTPPPVRVTIMDQANSRPPMYWVAFENDNPPGWALVSETALTPVPVSEQPTSPATAAATAEAVFDAITGSCHNELDYRQALWDILGLLDDETLAQVVTTFGIQPEQLAQLPTG